MASKKPILNSGRMGLLVFLALLGDSPDTHAASGGSPQAAICGFLVGTQRRSEVEREGSYDKFRHCALSCVITLQCGPLDAYNVGVMKELYDALGFGTASIDDLHANVVGIDLGMARDIETRKDCYAGCSKIYPRN